MLKRRLAAAAVTATSTKASTAAVATKIAELNVVISLSPTQKLTWTIAVAITDFESKKTQSQLNVENRRGAVGTNQPRLCVIAFAVPLDLC
jgi:hypothetical protein